MFIFLLKLHTCDIPELYPYWRAFIVIKHFHCKINANLNIEISFVEAKDLEDPSADISNDYSR